MKKQKGFTLIELLAVIVILAIIALIATPIVLNIIKDSKENAQLRSAEFYLKAVDQSVAKEMMNGLGVEDGVYNIMADGNLCLELNADKSCKKGFIKVEVSGEKPTSGTVEIKLGKRNDIKLHLQGNTIVEKDNKLVFEEDATESDNSSSSDDKYAGLEVYFDGEMEFAYNEDAGGNIGTTIVGAELGLPIQSFDFIFKKIYIIVEDEEPIELGYSGDGIVFVAIDGSGVMYSQDDVTLEDGTPGKQIVVLLPGVTGKKHIKILESPTAASNGFVQLRSSGYVFMFDYDFAQVETYLEIYDSEGTVYLSKDNGPYTLTDMNSGMGFYGIYELRMDTKPIHTAIENGKEITIKATQTVDGEERVIIYDGTPKYVENVGQGTYFWGNSMFEQSFT